MINISKNSTEKNSEAINIRTVQANSLYYVNNGVKEIRLDKGKAVINNSLFSEYMRKHGITVKKDGSSLDFVVMKYDYGTKEKSIGDKTIPKISSKKLREYYYENGATIPWEKRDKDEKLLLVRI